MGWSLRYEGQDNKNMTMVMKFWCYMAQISVNEQITWCDQCVHHVIRVGGLWYIGCQGLGKTLGLIDLDAVAIKYSR